MSADPIDRVPQPGESESSESGPESAERAAPARGTEGLETDRYSEIEVIGQVVALAISLDPEKQRRTRS